MHAVANIDPPYADPESRMSTPEIRRRAWPALRAPRGCRPSDTTRRHRVCMWAMRAQHGRRCCTDELPTYWTKWSSICADPGRRGRFFLIWLCHRAAHACNAHHVAQSGSPGQSSSSGRWCPRHPRPSARRRSFSLTSCSFSDSLDEVAVALLELLALQRAQPGRHGRHVSSVQVQHESRPRRSSATADRSGASRGRSRRGRRPASAKMRRQHRRHGEDGRPHVEAEPILAPAPRPCRQPSRCAPAQDDPVAARRQGARRRQARPRPPPMTADRAHSKAGLHDAHTVSASAGSYSGDDISDVLQCPDAARDPRRAVGW